MTGVTSLGLGSVMVVTTDNSGHPPEFWADRAMEHILDIADTTPEPLKQQAYAFRHAVHQVVLNAIKNAVKSDRANAARYVGKE